MFCRLSYVIIVRFASSLFSEQTAVSYDGNGIWLFNIPDFASRTVLGESDIFPLNRSNIFGKGLSCVTSYQYYRTVEKKTTSLGKLWSYMNQPGIIRYVLFYLPLLWSVCSVSSFLKENGFILVSDGDASCCSMIFFLFSDMQNLQ